jgi:hypothetical protein
MPWALSHRFSAAGVQLADRHYNRQKPGTAQFVPPGSNLVLLTPCARALWVTSWPLPQFTRHRWAGAWVNSLFRNEGAGLSSELIRSAVAATRFHYGAPPALGMVTFVNADKVRHKRDPGRCYLRAGFERDGHTQGGLVALRLLPERMPDPEPSIGANLALFGGAA